jgi:Zn-dependent peptidase ImmA (M78 family)/transcriptional regulator with XRE-family HTH domain
MDEATALGGRIRALRERAGLQGQELAAEIGLDPSAMSNIERGKRQVKTDELAKIATALRVSPLALLDDHSLPARMPVAPRAGKANPGAGPAYQHLLALAELHELLDDAGIGTTPALDEVPDLAGLNWQQSASLLAEWALQHLGVDAAGEDRFSALAAAIEDRLRVDVLVEEHDDDALAGATISDRSFPLVFVNADQPTPRALFTLAHELGHLLASHGEPITLDDTLVGITEDERAANLFAAAFLMPEAEVRNVIHERGRGAASLAYLMHHFGVSFESLIYRLQGLKEINAAGRDRLRAIGWSGFLAAIEGDTIRDAIPPEIRKSLAARQSRRPACRTPGWLVERTLDGYRRGVVSVRPLAGLLGEDPVDLIERQPWAATAGDLFFGDAVDDPAQDEGLEDSPV